MAKPQFLFSVSVGVLLLLIGALFSSMTPSGFSLIVLGLMIIGLTAVPLFKRTISSQHDSSYPRAPAESAVTIHVGER